VTLAWILLGSFAGGALSMAAAALFAYTVLSRFVERMISFAVGMMLATALLNVLPEAFESRADVRVLFGLLLAGLLGFFLLEKLALFRHSHHFEHDGHGHASGHDAHEAGRGGMLILVGDSLHNFCDGIIIAAAFLADFRLGVVTSLSIMAHEVPQEVGDFMVLLNAGFSKPRAFLYNFISSMASLVGGVAGYLFLDGATGAIPYVLVVAASSFIYIAVADLMPQMQRRTRLAESIPQVALIALGVAVVVATMAAVGNH
jgi:zinc and cadmium transporter